MEDTGYHELAEENVDRAFVHSGRPAAALAIATLAYMACDALQAYFNRERARPGQSSTRPILDPANRSRRRVARANARTEAKRPAGTKTLNKT